MGKVKGVERVIQPQGCAVCNRSKILPTHHGCPPSFNVFGSGANRFRWQDHIQMWKARWIELVEESGLPKGLAGISYEADITFDRRVGRGRDQGNFRVLLDKSLGDALQSGGWIQNDKWENFDAGELTHQITPGVACISLVLMPR